MKNFLLLTMGLMLWLLGCQPFPKADLLLFNGQLYTVNDQQPTAEAIAVREGRIVFVGTNEEAEGWKERANEVIDLKGHTLIPGFVESHAHLLRMGSLIRQVNLMQTPNYEALIQQVKAVADTTPTGQWIIGRGWHQSKWDKLPAPLYKGYQTHQALSEAVPNHPVALTHASGHALFANAKAMEIAGIQVHQDYGEEGEIILDENGNPTGIFTENAMRLIRAHLPAESQASRMADATAAMEECFQHGITALMDAGASQLDIDAYQSLKDKGALPLRLYVMLAGKDSAFLVKWFEQGPVIDPTHQLTIRSVKLYADGALGSRGAWLLAPYTDRPNHMGNPISSMPYVGWVATQGLEHGFQVCTHAIGDRANREVLNQYETAFKTVKADNPRFRIEHAQHIDPDDIPRFANLDVIAAMQGIHFSSDRPWAIYRLGQQRIEQGAYRWQQLLASGAKVINGTDAPVEPVNPIPCFYASITRKTLAGKPEEGYEADQRMTRAQALASYTLEAAYGSFAEDQIGSLEVGKLADFAILSQDIMQVPEEEVLTTSIMATFVGGKQVFSAPESSILAHK